MKRMFYLLFTILIFYGCSGEEKLQSASYERKARKEKLSIRQIDSITAGNNFSFSKRNIVSE